MTAAVSSFEGLGLSTDMLARIGQAGYSSPTPIQRMAIPHALAGQDVIGCAQTGTGKTAAFVIPIIERLADGRGTRALILAPTRELAMQVQKVVDQLGRRRGVGAALIVGGENMQQQERALRQGPDVVVGTPGRLLDHMWRGTTLVFTRTKSRADRVGRMLVDDGVPTAVLHSNRTMSQRREALEGFKRGKYRVLVATDIMARGIHVNGIAHVINYDLPNSPE